MRSLMSSSRSGSPNEPLSCQLNGTGTVAVEVGDGPMESGSSSGTSPIHFWILGRACLQKVATCCIARLAISSIRRRGRGEKH